MNNELKQAITRLIVLVIALINSLLAHYGKPVIQSDEAFIYQTLSDLILIGSIAWGYWKNNNFTHNAQQAQKFKNVLDIEDNNEKMEEK
ncbi:phage holin [Macrococcoides caseolyticum]|uniref:phage holin n=1 Tax=Macrococcoides caseolyticum TaxID=69966 RepID=UPI000C33548C|nr:phage holin [Macrococcus caseolyticus]PKE07298.1 phage holin [Macrococcus caseolyticus]PKE54039.1 phage holin [Macrococcus caseolyticus]PKF39122.1 phage holin [Macrococcus caseolyticus]